MKRILTLLTFLISAVLIFNGCSSNENAGNNTGNLEELAQKYRLEDAVLAGITAEDWNSPEEIRTDNLISFYMFCHIDTGWEPEMPAEELETFIQQYFDVTSEYMRTNEYYNDSVERYIRDGIGSVPASIRLEKVEQIDNTLSLSYAIYASEDANEPKWGGVLTLQTTDDGFRYTSNKKWD